MINTGMQIADSFSNSKNEAETLAKLLESYGYNTLSKKTELFLEEVDSVPDLESWPESSQKIFDMIHDTLRDS